MSAVITQKRDLLFSNKALFTLILPLIVEQALAVFVGMADSMMVASVGEAAVSGVSLIDNIMVLVIYTFSALATGGAVVAGQYLGLQNEVKARTASNELVWFCGVASLAMMLLVYALKGFILNVVFGQITAEVYGHAEIYLMITNLSIPFIAIYNGGASIFRTMGNSKVTMSVSMMMNAINLIGNAICIYLLKMGTAGVAIPTLLSRMTAAVVITAMLFDKKRPLYLEKTLRHRFSGMMVKRILRVGIPSGVENGMFQFGKILLLSVVSTFGTPSITANAVTSVFASMEVIPGLAISLALTTIIARCVGANHYEQAKYYNKKLILFSMAANLLVCTACILLLPTMIRLYGLSAETTALTIPCIWIHAIGSVLLWPAAFNLPATFRAAGDVKTPMVISVVSMWVFRLLSGYILSTYLGLGVIGVWLAYLIDWTFRSVVFLHRYTKSKWMKYRVV